LLPKIAIPLLKRQLDKVQLLHQRDLKGGFGKTILPKALNKKYPNESSQLRWQYVFPSSKRSTDPRTKLTHRYHISGSWRLL